MSKSSQESTRYQYQEQEEWICADCGTTLIAVGASRIFCPSCDDDMVKREEPDGR